MSVRYTSRIPEITHSIPVKTLIGLGVGAHLVQEAAKERVPVRTGALKDAIHIEQERAGQAFRVVAGDSKAFYGHMVEHGTTRAPARPFLVPALESKRREVELAVARALRSL